MKNPVPSPGVQRHACRIPVAAKSGTVVLLQAELYLPPGSGPFPLVTLNHGVPRDESIENLKRTRVRFARAAEWFAARGFVVAVALRQGFGASEGEFSEQSGPCDDRDFLAEGAASAADMRGIVEFMQRHPWVDAKRVLIVGQSRGGLGALALAGNPPNGLLGIISFAGARGSKAPGTVCCEDRLIAAMACLGARNRCPGLWLFSENDSYFCPAVAERLFAAYASASAYEVDFVRLPPFGSDGHRTLYEAAPEVWSAQMSSFLGKLGL